MPSQPTILFAGGGSGGHIFPGIAIRERLLERMPNCQGRFVVSFRQIDTHIMTAQQLPFTTVPVLPFSPRPWRWFRFLRAWSNSVRTVRKLIAEQNVVAVVTTGGFVSAPAVIAARKCRVPVAMVNLDAVPGRANRMLLRHAGELFTAYRHPIMPSAVHIGVPLRRHAIGPDDPREARAQLGLDPERHTLLITGASQGAQSVNRMMVEMTRLTTIARTLAHWQVLHLAGAKDVDAIRAAYTNVGIPARVETFIDRMGLAWRAATVAISRAGAGSVAEAWVNATPTIFMPYPYHKDEHQKHNAQPLVAVSAAILLRDQIDPIANARAMIGPLSALVTNEGERNNMSRWMRENRPPDGAQAVTDWLVRILNAQNPNISGKSL